MYDDLYLMNNDTPNRYVGVESDDFNNFAIQGFNELLETPVAKDIEVYNSDLTYSFKTKAIIQAVESSSKIKSIEREVIININICHAGMYIKYKNRFWLITGFVDDNGIYDKVIVVLCQWFLKWQDGNGELLGRWVSIGDPGQSIGIDFFKTMTLSSDQMVILCPIDRETLLLEHPKRFIIGNGLGHIKTYKITTVNTTTYYYNEDDGIIILIATRDELRKDDRVDLGICDYIPPINSPSSSSDMPSSQTISCQISYKSLQLKVGVKRTYKAIFKDQYDNILNNISANWLIDNDFNGIIKSSLTDNSITLFVDDNSLIGENVKLILNDSKNKCSDSVILEITDIY